MEAPQNITLPLFSFYRHGIDTFNNKEDFKHWLSTKNQFLDNRAPKEFLGTISGIQFIDNRLTAIEYGENA